MHAGKTVTIVPTGTANLASVAAAFARLGAVAHIAADRREIERAEYLVLPGVGAFAAAMDELGALGLIEPLRERLVDGRPALAICLGMQVLLDESEESPGVSGLGIVTAKATRITSPAVRVPHLGWSNVVPAPKADGGGGVVVEGFAYFAHSFRIAAPLTRSPAADALGNWSLGVADHGGDFVASMQRGGLLACQFHPELSGAWGSALLSRWLAQLAAAEHIVKGGA